MKVKIIDFGGKIPTRSHYNDAGADVYSLKDYVLWPGQNITVPLGFGLELPDGWGGFCFQEPALAQKESLVIYRRLIPATPERYTLLCVIPVARLITLKPAIKSGSL